MARGHYRREMLAWAGLALGIGVVEGGVGGVIAINYFAGAVSSNMLDFAVAVLVGASAFSNIASFIWSGLSHGKHKIHCLVALQVASMAFVALIAFAPINAVGLFMLIVGVVGARVCWSGVTILRSTVWRLNYPRHARAMMAGKIATIQTLFMAAGSFGIGYVLEDHPNAFRILFPIMAALGMVGAWIYSGMRMRGHRALLRAEKNEEKVGHSAINPLLLWKVLKEDGRYRRYMICMFFFGMGNIMVSAPLIIMLDRRFNMDPTSQVMIVTTLPLLLIPFSVPIWSKLLDRVHVIEFRAIHSWAFVTANAVTLLGAVLFSSQLIWLGAICRGIAFGGGVLAWNLGHHDFAPVEKASHYMGVHVTLTGLRGIIAPFFAVGMYQILEKIQPDAGAWVFAICLGLCVVGAIGFVKMRRSLSGSGHDSKFSDGPPVQPPAAV